MYITTVEWFVPCFSERRFFICFLEIFEEAENKMNEVKQMSFLVSCRFVVITHLYVRTKHWGNIRVYTYKFIAISLDIVKLIERFVLDPGSNYLHYRSSWRRQRKRATEFTEMASRLWSFTSELQGRKAYGICSLFECTICSCCQRCPSGI